MSHNFGSECRHGQDAVRECAETGILPEHITSQINNDPNRTKTCRVIKETNAEMKSRLPGTAYYIVSTETDEALVLQVRAAGGDRSTVSPVTAMGVHGTFADAAPAIDGAREVAQAIADRVDNASVQDMGPKDCFVRAFGIFADSSKLRVVGVRRDDGRIAR